MHSLIETRRRALKGNHYPPATFGTPSAIALWMRGIGRAARHPAIKRPAAVLIQREQSDRPV
jgi:hypothetical protein